LENAHSFDKVGNEIAQTMQPTNKQRQLAQTLDTWVKTIEKRGGGDIEILQNAFDHMPTFKELLDTTTHEQMDALCVAYPGFYRFAKLLEAVAQGIKDGTVRVPSVN
jgi:hypothetical protein